MEVLDHMRHTVNKRMLGGLWCLLALLFVPSSFPLPAAAAGSVSVVAWVCPAGTNPATDPAALPTTCAQPSDTVTFALTAGGLTRRRVAAGGQPASWPAVAGPFTLAIDTPAGEPAIAVCDQNGTATRYDAPGGVVNGQLAADTSLACRWYRLTPAATAPTPAPTPTALPAGTPTAPPAGTPSAAEFAGPVNIGGRSLFVSCTGAGSPTVLLEAGGPGGVSDRWAPVVAQLAATTRVCRYDRAGLGKSDPPPAGIRTIQDSVNDLRALLNVFPLGCPCVFAGESWGGSIVRLFAGQFPSDIAGLVFVDAMPPGFVDQFSGLVPADQPGFAALMGTDNPEHMDQLASFRKAEAAAPPPPVPIVVITHGLVLGFPLNFPVEKLEAIWRSGQEAYARATHARLVVAQKSGNSVVHDQPDVVATALQVVVGAIRDPTLDQPALVVHRLDASGHPLPGSCFQIYADAGGGKRGEFRGGACDTDVDNTADGVIRFTPLPAGNYVLQEVKPPDGVPAVPDMPVVLSGLATDVDVKSAGPATPTAPQTVTPTATATATAKP
jgi:pimeloyl-ACP methyl ester carboxylesterase